MLFDAGRVRAGDTVFLKSLAFDPMAGGGMMGGMRGMMGMMGGPAGGRLPEGLEFNLLKLVVTQGEAGPRAIPARLSTLAPLHTGGVPPRRIELSMGHMQWLIKASASGPTPRRSK